MRTWSAAFQTELDAGRICRAAKITQADSTVWGITNHDKPLTISGVVFESIAGDIAGALRSSAGAQVDNLKFQGAWVAGTTEQDLIDGAYDDLIGEALMVAWALNPPEAVTLCKLKLSELSWDRDGFAATLVDGFKALGGTVGETAGPGCPYVLGDTWCTVNLSSYAVSGSVTSVSASRTIFADTGRAEADAWFADGLVTFTTGANAGRSFTVETFSAGSFTLQLPSYRDIVVGDAYTATPGCDKTPDAGGCNKFSNRLNFGGWPFLRGETQVSAQS